MKPISTLYLIPSFLDEEGMDAIPAYVVAAVKQCQVFFVENERSARRFLKAMWREMPIDQYEWFAIHKAEEQVREIFLQKISESKTIGIISEAGCPGVADPGQILVEAAQRAGITVRPLVGPNAILLALMASGMNGQQFQFVGYLPIDAQARIKRIRELEAESAKTQATQIFIETPYRNRQLIEAMVKTCRPQTRLCIAVDLTGKGESIRTHSILEWKTKIPDIDKHPAVFLLHGG